MTTAEIIRAIEEKTGGHVRVIRREDNSWSAQLRFGHGLRKEAVHYLAGACGVEVQP